jgi:plastocyanin
MTMYIAVGIIIIIIIGVAAFFYLGQWNTSPTKIIRLNGSATTGWNSTLNTLSFTVSHTDRVRIVLISSDSGLHNFVIAFSGSAPSGTPNTSGGDIVSHDFTSPTIATNFDFTPSKTGAFTFYCQYHVSTGMKGTITVT